MTSDPATGELSCLEEVHISNVKPGEGLVSSRTSLAPKQQQILKIV